MNRIEMIAYCLSKPGAYEDTPFGPDTLVLKVMSKMFALTGMSAMDHKFNLKCDPHHALLLRQTYPDDVVPGYHMNKKHWNTITIDGSVPDDLLKELVDESYDLVVAGMSKHDREILFKKTITH